MKINTAFIARTAVIAALYATLTIALSPISYGPLQFRVAEALTVLPLLFAEVVPGLTIGCFIANMASGPIDMVVGTLATLVAALMTRAFRKIYFGIFPPIIINAFAVPVIFLTIPDITTPYFFNVLTIFISQLGAVVLLGVPLYFAVKRLSKTMIQRK